MHMLSQHRLRPSDKMEILQLIGILEFIHDILHVLCWKFFLEAALIPALSLPVQSHS